ncbi:hypothetical protein AALP_AA7G108600 [Arabis alpina]|uniref:Uncharacterized protein n=1 Tax=Arabis alpina TaxID=50452 RepID=A0A087GH96_ARAAL|nr:hypothetical protein AALP_AA7G108600 [Arabis alpina]
MATAPFCVPTADQTSVGNPNELVLRNNQGLVNVSGEIRTEPQKTRGRKPGSKKGQQNPKKERLRGMGVAQLERHRIEEERKMLTGASASPRTTRLPVSNPAVVLQGFPSSYGGGPAGGCRNRFICGGVGSGQIMIDPVCPPWGFVETAPHELSSIPNNRCDTGFKKMRLDGDHNVVRSNGGGGFSKYTMIPMNGYDQRTPSFCYDHRLPRSSASFNPYFNEPTNHMVSMEEFGSYMEGSPRNGSGGVKEYEFFPGKFDDEHGKPVSVATSLADCSPNTSTIDLSLKL